ncbi:zf-3CxxC domain-containing protein [Caerostris darwini]|uniref:Zf-3CxxC domain-containing protein n=1 Tax=Caerostris darwini TaxID=1538125 RepID=A0AAV4RHE7_9ARAC|nr:zf-3CxxC domain-containing protein [Caerostris darwini]
MMSRFQLKTRDIRKEGRMVVVHGKGQFLCNFCSNCWNSFFSWIQIDLMEQRIVYRWKMKCKECCINPRHIGVEPTFELAETEKLIEKAIYKYKGERYPRGAAYRGSRIPHPNVLCEKCLWGQTQCWLTMHR